MPRILKDRQFNMFTFAILIVLEQYVYENADVQARRLSSQISLFIATEVLQINLWTI